MPSWSFQAPMEPMEKGSYVSSSAIVSDDEYDVVYGTAIAEDS